MFTIFIASSYEYYSIHLPRLLENIKETDILPNDVYFIIGGCPEERYESINEIHIYRTMYRCFEFTPFQFINTTSIPIPYDYVFCTHDTVVFGPTFYNKTCSIIEKMIEGTYTTFGIGHDRTMSYNIGIYHRNIIYQASLLLSEIITYDSNTDTLLALKTRLIEYEDRILNSGNRMSIYSDPVIQIVDKVTIDNEKITSRIKRFNEVDLIKVQMNYNGIYSISTFKDFPKWND
jgi:hypothetical protein